MSGATDTLPAGPRRPAVIQGMQFVRDEFGLLADCRERYGNVFTLRMWPFGPLVVVAEPPLVKEIYTGDTSTLYAGKANATLEPIIGSRSLMVLEEGEHLQQRRLLLPPLHSERMRAYGEVMRDVVDAEIDSWPLGTPFEMHGSMLAAALRVITRTVFGIEETARMQEIEALMHRVMRLGEPVTMISLLRRDLGPFSPWARFCRAREELDQVIFEEIRDRRATESWREREDVLSLLLGARYEDGREMTEREIRDELVTLLVTGHATSASTLSWAVERLTRSPEPYARLKRSVAEGDDAYLENVVKEVMRIRPVVSFAVRGLNKPLDLNGWHLPPGITVGTSIYLMHTREDLYPDPEAFRPERFDDPSTETYTNITFGGGVRRCIGAAFAHYEAKIMLRRIFERCDLSAPDREPEPDGRQLVAHVPGKGARVVLDARD
ncbi:MAG: cytochrome P450 [Thermoleophilaceae bacterium]